MSTNASLPETIAVQQLPWLHALCLLPVIYRAEWAKIHRPGREGRAAQTILSIWTLGILAGVVLLVAGLLVEDDYLIAGGVCLTAVSIPLPIVNALVLPGWHLWADPERGTALLTGPQGNLCGFWSINGGGLNLALNVMAEMLDHHGRASYKPRSERHARAYEAGVKRLGAHATPRNEKKPLGWWDVRRDNKDKADA